MEKNNKTLISYPKKSKNKFIFIPLMEKMNLY